MKHIHQHTLLWGTRGKKMLTFQEQLAFSSIFYMFVKQAIKLFCQCAVITINTPWKDSGNECPALLGVS